MRSEIILQFIPGYELGQFGPAVVSREFTPECQEEVLKRELLTRYVSIHFENSGRLLGKNKLICAHFTSEHRSDPLRNTASAPYQEAVYRTKCCTIRKLRK